MKSKTNKIIFTVLTIIAWFIFVGLCIEAGGLLVNFLFSIFKPEATPYLNEKLDLHGVYYKSTASFYTVYFFILSISLLKVWLFYLVVLLVTKIDLLKPFTRLVSRQINNISYTTFAIGLFCVFATAFFNHLQASGFDVKNLHNFSVDGRSFIVIAALIYTIAFIFSRGVDNQEELEETV